METEILLIPQGVRNIGTKSVTLRENIEKIIGRAGNKVDISYNSKVISRKHAVFLFKNEKIYIQDCGSSSGTFVNMKRISPIGQPSDLYEIKDEDILQFGETYQQNDVIHQCVQVKFYSKLTNEESLSQDVIEKINNEYKLNCKVLDDKSDLKGIFFNRSSNKKNGSLRKVTTDEFRNLQVKYTLDPLINDTDMALFMIAEDLLTGYPDVQKSVIDKIKNSPHNTKDPSTGFFRRKSEINSFGQSNTIQRKEKPEKIVEQQSGNLNLSPIF
eukprot:NODE_950_length_2933_cov_0.834157.p2 type:complete len:271 gc:universal NODE_950_length_2933_cov_0.834157:2026-2838(+)